MAKNLGQKPKAVVVIGGQAVMARDYNLTLTNKSEADTLSCNIDLEHIDSSVFLNKGQIQIEVWSGYIDERTQSATYFDLIKNKEYEKYLFLRFEGIVDQPEFHVGFDDYLSITARDYIGVLMDVKFSDQRKDSQTSAKNIVNFIQSKVKGLTITLDKDVKDYYLGKQDPKTKARTYSIAGKTYWNVLLDVARSGGLNIFKKGKNIVLTKRHEVKQIWHMIKAATKDETRPWGNFEKVTLRMGDNFKAGKDNVFVQVYAHTAPKKSHVTPGAKPKKKKGGGTIKPIVGKWPKNASDFIGEEDVHYIEKRMGTLTQQQADAIAENLGKEYLRSFVTGDTELAFANPEMFADDGIDFYVATDHPKYNSYNQLFINKDKNRIIFRIESIDEKFSMEGFSQSIEFETSSYELIDSDIKRIVEMVRSVPDRLYYVDGTAYGSLDMFNEPKAVK